MALVVMFLGAVVAANLTVAHYGPAAVIPVGFTLVAFDLVARDGLHELWRGKHLAVRMGLLIAAGGALSAMVNAGAGRIALASCVAFTVSQALDAVVYSLLGDRARLLRINSSNVAGGVTDSAVFLTLAFGSFMPGLIAGQVAAKVLGGFVWSLVLVAFQRRREPVLAPAGAE